MTAARDPLAVRAAITAAVTAFLHVAVVAGLVPDEVEASVAAAVDAAGLVVLVLWARPAVTPNASVVAAVDAETGATVAADAHPLPNGAPVVVVGPGRPSPPGP